MAQHGLVWRLQSSDRWHLHQSLKDPSDLTESFKRNFRDVEMPMLLQDPKHGLTNVVQAIKRSGFPTAQDLEYISWRDEHGIFICELHFHIMAMGEGTPVFTGHGQTQKKAEIMAATAAIYAYEDDIINFLCDGAMAKRQKKKEKSQRRLNRKKEQEQKEVQATDTEETHFVLENHIQDDRLTAAFTEERVRLVSEAAEEKREAMENMAKSLSDGHKAAMAEEKQRHNREVEMLNEQLLEAKGRAAKDQRQLLDQRQQSDKMHAKMAELQSVLDDVIDQGHAEQRAHKQTQEELEQQKIKERMLLQKEKEERARSSELLNKLRRGETHECKICWDSAATHAVLPCGHFCMCKRCVENVIRSSGKCPVCKCAVESDVKVFMC
eukprot:TRINITY_DN11366_c0_g1_i2.p1 TRINITY_DN11366_c0_g1~~TRINITY_DN11366_c0_g1_i2.p1  ORF type:complete len:381 (-),score=95.80 TRINITY_DN11366_c0_g1_i2:23-1165(-)